ncbi:MAG TPA: glycosyltransferase [Gemmatimonadaceae bacterium]|jgi:glycosyltransferase involved in cell wall biosynthesis|nr:glycosyltransferase [Gemmatimonadaceae bacterium]
MRVLFYVGDKAWSGCARVFVAAARGLGARGHQVTLVCPGGSATARRAEALGVDTVPADPDATAAGDAWGLRRILQERFVEVAFVHTDREQLVVSSAMRLAERGAIIRRVPAFLTPALLRSGRLALRIASAGLIFTTEAELAQAQASPELAAMPLAPAVAPLGVDVVNYESIQPVARESIGVPAQGLLIVCSYEPNARLRLATAMRTLALLLPRHPGVHLAVLGPGSQDDDLRMHAAALGVGTSVTFLGQRSDDLAVLRAADAGWVVAGADDGAFAFLDLMAMRLPVLAERGVLPKHYVADGITGLLLSPGAPSHTAAAAAPFFAHQELRMAMGNAARTRVQREFSEADMIDGFERAASAGADRKRWSAR